MLNCLLVAGTGGGGEEVFLRELVTEPPGEVSYQVSWGSRDSTVDARVQLLRQVAFNRLLHPLIHPLPGLRSYRLTGDFDLVHVHNYLFSLSPKGRLPPVVMTVGGGGYPHYLREYLGWTQTRISRLYRRSSRILPPLGIGNEIASHSSIHAIGVFSRFAADELKGSGVPDRKLHIIPPGFPTPSGPTSTSVGEREEVRVLFVGRDAHRKGADLLIGAVRELRRDGVRVRALLVGDPSFQELVGEEGFEVKPWLSREELYRDIYPDVDLFSLPARSEGFGFVAVEAMSFGIPVILSDQGAFPEILGESGGGIRVPVGRVSPLKAALRQLCDDPGKRKTMGLMARKRFQEKFSREAHREALKGMYSSVLDRWE